MHTAEDWIKHLDLRPHPEGGCYRETYRSAGNFHPDGFSGPRALSTGIYFLLRQRECSHLHRIRSDELWHFYDGGPLILHQLSPSGEYRNVTLGRVPEQGETLQAVIPAGNWFGAELQQPAPYALVGCTVAPGFDFADFELGRRADLLQQYPQHHEIIERLTLLHSQA